MKLIRLLPVLLLVSAIVNAQKIHIGVFGGVSAYNGDLVDKILPANGATNAAFGATHQIIHGIRSGFAFCRKGKVYH